MSATNELLQEGRYRISQEFPQVGRGSVYEAYDTVRDTTVVVKEIPVTLNKVTTVSQQELLKLAFANQAKILTEINHDSLLHVHDFFSEIGRQYLVMESVDGDDLRELLGRNKSAFAVSDVLSWADNLLDALNYLHTYKPPIIHRNIRPENVKLNSLGKIKLLAFGLADGSDTRVNTTISAESPDQPVINYSPLEQIWEGLDSASQKVITNSYDERSERILKEPADARSDIYAMGATLYHLITAQQPIDALERSIEILDGKPDPLTPPNKLDPNIPVEISDFLLKAMEIKRENRYDSAAIMRQVLRTAQIRAKEREEETRDEQEATEYIKAAEQNKIDQANQAAEQKRLEMESARESEAEEARLLAERLAADAEQKRLELEVEKARQAEEARMLADQLAAEAEQKQLELEAAKEREAEEARLLAEQLAADAEQERQTELLKEQLREAEEQRQFVEQRAVEAEEERQAQLIKEQEREAEAQQLLAEQRAGEAERLLVKQRAVEEEKNLAEQRAAELEEELQAQSIIEQEREAETQKLLAEERAEETERLLAKQRAVEEEKLQAEQRVAEVRKRIEEQEAAIAAKTKNAANVSDDDLLDIALSANGVSHSEESLSDNEDVSFAEVLTDESDDQAFTETAAAESEVVMYSSEAVPSAYESKSYKDEPDLSMSTGSSFGKPAIAIGAVAVVIIAAAVWMFMPSGSSESIEPKQSQATSVNETAPQTSELPAVDTNPVASEIPVDETASDSVEPVSQADPSVKAALQKAKKPAAPAKTPVPKKAVTVDDLINDN